MRLLFFVCAIFVMQQSTAQTPVIHSFSPAIAKANDTIVISGEFFSSTADSNFVHFGIVSGRVINASTTQLSVIVPTSAAEGPLTVTVRRRSTISKKNFQPRFTINDYPLDEESLSLNKVFLRPMVEYLATNGYDVITAHDLNGDGRPELIASLKDSSNITILVNASTGGVLRFSDTLKFSIGLSISDLQIADFDGDGKPDIAVANNNQHTVSILKNNSTSGIISFEPKTTFILPLPVFQGTQLKPEIYLRIEDITKDGLPDIFAVFSASAIGYLLVNNSAGNIIEFKSNPIGYALNTSYIKDLVFRDLNEDNNSELVILNANSITPTMLIYQIARLGGDTLRFTKAFELPLQPVTMAFSVSHFNADEKPDLLINAVQPNSLRLFINNSTGNTISFQLAAVDTLPIGGLHMAVGDISGNQKNDVLIDNSQSPNGLRVIQHRTQDSVLNFSTSTTIAPPLGYYSLQKLKIADLSNDGKPDVYGLNYRIEGMFINVLTNEQDNTPSIKSFSPTIADSGDTITITGRNFLKVNKVSFQDSLASSFQILSDTLIKAVVGKAEPGFVFVSNSKFKDSLAGFSFARPVITDFSPKSAKIGDTVVIDGQYFDTSIVNTFVQFGAVKANVISATKNKITVTVPAGASYGSISVTAKSRTDISRKHFTPVFFDKGYAIQKNAFTSFWIDSSKSGSPVFQKPVSYDINGDGKPEIISLIKDSSIIRIFKNESNGMAVSFKKATDLPTGKNPSGIKIADFNHDGKLDIVITYKDASEPNISVYKNTSTTQLISFDARQNYTFSKLINVTPSNDHVHALGLGDFNNDGRTDIVLSSGKGNAFSILLNTSTNGIMSFGKGVDFNLFDYYSYVGGGENMVEVNDINGDGRPDIIMNNAVRAAVVIINNSFGNISFKAPINLDAEGPQPAIAKSVNVIDIDGDNKQDIVVNDDGQIVYYKNASTTDSVKFTTVNKISTKKWNAISVGHLNGDTRPDIFALVNSSTTDSIPHTVFKNNTANNIEYGLHTLNSLPKNVQLSSSIMQDLNGDGKQDVIGLNVNGLSIYALINKIDLAPSILSFSPTSAGFGDTVRIKGHNFTGTSAIKFKDSAAFSFTVESDSVIQAVVNTGQTGMISVTNNFGTDSIAGFTFNHPTLTFLPAQGITISAVKNIVSNTSSYAVKGANLQGPVQVVAPRLFEISQSAAGNFGTTTTLVPVKGKLDSTVIYVRFKSDTTSAAVSDSLIHYTAGLAGKKYGMLVNMCDSALLFKPVINNITIDSTILCYKQDSITLSVTNNNNYNIYRWSTGDTTATIRIGNTSNISVRVGSKTTCISTKSPLVRVVKNNNTTPSLGLTNDSILVSTTAPQYRWYFNNKLTNDTSSTLIARKVGFYRVETSNNNICWDASAEFPILLLPRTASPDTVKVRLFPNPASGGFFNVVATLERVTNVIARVTVTDASGLILVQTNKFIFFGREIKIPVTVSTYKGTAFVRVEINGDIETQTIILQ